MELPNRRKTGRPQRFMDLVTEETQRTTVLLAVATPKGSSQRRF